MKQAFTMIELVFVIVIIGILAAVAIPKLAATRTDAKVSAEVASLKIAIDKLGGEFVAKRTITAASYTEANADVHCFTITKNGNFTDGNFTVAPIPAANPPRCDAKVWSAAKELAAQSNLLGTGGVAKDFIFLGSSVIR